MKSLAVASGTKADADLLYEIDGSSRDLALVTAMAGYLKRQRPERPANMTLPDRDRTAPKRPKRLYVFILAGEDKHALGFGENIINRFSLSILRLIDAAGGSDIVRKENVET
ncbi:hypothetical protein GCM10011487_44980 [Steroidobacter agaridevorans]|uniref:Uncharacterized protein n=1 Tax=Steroidobacter agaridevorans TaxID=2695856 RepID=A0A829YI47_9GAMM|nr:hypothetical protein GCM10011487_44980 [Steroidobacter agaridevorans]